MIRAQPLDVAGGEVGAERAVEVRRVVGRRGVQRQRDQHGALALDQVVAGGLAGGRRVAEDPEQVVAELERLAQRQPERRQLGQRLRRRRRPARRRAGAGARWSTSPTCSAAPSSPWSTSAWPRACTETSRNCPAITSLRHRSKHVEGGRDLGRRAARSGAAARRTRRAAGRRAGSPPAAPYCSGSPRQPRAAVLGLEGAVRGRAAAAAVGGVHEVVVDQRAGVQQLQRGARRGPPRPRRRARRRRGGPTSRTTRGTSCRRPPTSGPRPAAGTASGPSGRSRSACSSRKASERGLHPRAGSRPGPTPHSRRLGDRVSLTPRAVRWIAVRSGPAIRRLGARDATRRGPSIRELLDRGDRSFSFEFFPPKDEAGEEQLWQAISALEPYAPSFVSVTYGAGGGTRDKTIGITGRIARETSMTPVAHLTCVGHTRAELEGILDAYAAAGHPARDAAARRPRATGRARSGRPPRAG